MADSFVWMATCLLGLSTGLLTRSASSIFAITFAVAGFGTEMGATLEFSTTDLSTADILEPALLILETLLATHAAFLNQERTSWTAFVVHVAIVLDLRMATRLSAIALEPTRWRLSTARQRWCQNGTTTVAIDLIKDRFSTRSARTLVTEVFAEVVAAFEGSTTRTRTNVLGLEPVINRSDVSFLKFATLTLEGLSFRSLALALATAFVASMTTTVESGSANPHTLRRFDLALVTNGG